VIYYRKFEESVFNIFM